MHLSVQSYHLAVGINDGGTVVIDSGCPPLKEGSNDDDFQFFRELFDDFCCRTRNRLGEIEKRCILDLTEVLREEEFREAYDMCSGIRRLLNLQGSFPEVLVRVGAECNLNESDAEFLWSRHGVFFHSNEISDDKSTSIWCEKQDCGCGAS